MLYNANPNKILSNNVFFMRMILIDLDGNLSLNFSGTYLVAENDNERLVKQKLDLVVL